MIMWNAIHWKFIYIVTSQWNLIWLVKRERECNLNLWNRSHVICPFRLQSADLSVSLLLKDHEVQGDVLITLYLLLSGLELLGLYHVGFAGLNVGLKLTEPIP